MANKYPGRAQAALPAQGSSRAPSETPAGLRSWTPSSCLGSISALTIGEEPLAWLAIAAALVLWTDSFLAGRKGADRTAFLLHTVYAYRVFKGKVPVAA